MGYSTPFGLAIGQGAAFKTKPPHKTNKQPRLQPYGQPVRRLALGQGASFKALVCWDTLVQALNFSTLFHDC